MRLKKEEPKTQRWKRWLAGLCALAIMLSVIPSRVAAEETDTPVKHISLGESSINLVVGDSETVTATVSPENATDKTVTWSSDKESVATVDQSGKITAVAKGTATITAKAGDQTAAVTVTVTEPVIAVTDVSLNKSELTLTEGSSETVTATVSPENATDKTVTWSSDKESVAKVDDSGKITAVAKGTAKITAKAGDKSAAVTVTVTEPVIAVTDVSLNKSELTLTEGSSETVTATVSPENATDKTVTWSSDKETVAKVDDSGKITAVAKGTAKITAKAGDKSAAVTVTVTKPATSVTVDPTSVTLKKGEKKDISATVLPEGSTDTVIWSSDKESVATVDNTGKVTAKHVGTAKITAKAGEKTATVSVTVEPIEVTISDITFDGMTYDGKQAIPSGNVHITLTDVRNGDEVKLNMDKVTFNRDTANADDISVTASGSVALSGSNAGDYKMSTATDSVEEINQLLKEKSRSIKVEPKEITKITVSFEEMNYNAGTDVKVKEVVLDGVLDADKNEVKLDNVTFKREDANEGSKEVSGTGTVSLGGSKAGNYVLKEELKDAAKLTCKNVTVNPVELCFVLDGLNKDFDNDDQVKTAPAATLKQATLNQLPEAVRNELLGKASVTLTAEDAKYESAGNVAESTKTRLIPADENKTYDVYIGGSKNSNYNAKLEAGAEGSSTIKKVEISEEMYVLPEADYKDGQGIKWYHGDEDGKITVSASGAGNTISDELNGTYGENTKVSPNDENKTIFYIKTVEGTIGQVVLDDIRIDQDAPSFTIVDVYQGGKVQFGNEVLKYTIQVSDNGSGVDATTIQYMVSTGDKPSVGLNGWKKPTEVVRNDDKYTITVALPQSGKLYVTAKDQVGNAAVSDALRTLVLENTAPELKVEVDGQEINEAYTKNHSFTISAKDNGDHYSGIAKVEWSLKQDDESKPVASVEKTNPTPNTLEERVKKLEPETSKAPDNLNGTYKLIVKAYDFCGNETEVVKTLNFDNIAPEVKVRMTDGVKYTENGSDVYYYKADNFGIQVTFSDDRMMDGGTYQVTVSGMPDPVKVTAGAGETSKSVTIDADIITKSRLDDGKHTITVKAVDNAGNKADALAESAGVTANGMEATFVLDTTAPKLTKVESTQGNFYENDGLYYNGAFTTTFTVDEANYDAEKAKVKSDRESLDGVYTVDDNTDDKASITYKVTPKAGAKIPRETFAISLEVTDKAGNKLVADENMTAANDSKVTVKEGKATLNTIRVLDNVAPVARLSYTALDKSHYFENEGYYYKDSFTVNYDVTDAGTNVDATQVNLISLGYSFIPAEEGNQSQITGSAVDNNGLSVVDDGKSATAQYNIAATAGDKQNNGTYHFEIQGTDKAGNRIAVQESTPIMAAGEIPDTVKTTAETEFEGVAIKLDTIAPTAKLTYTPLDDTNYYDESGTIHAYYNKDIEATLTVEDINGVAKDFISFFSTEKSRVDEEGNPVRSVVAAPKTTDGQPKTPMAWTGKIAVSGNHESDGFYQFHVFGTDKAGNPLTVTEEQADRSDAAQEKQTLQKTECGTDDATVMYNGGVKVLDTKAPTGTLSYTALNKTYRYDNSFYYNKNLTASYVFNDENTLDAAKLFTGKNDAACPDQVGAAFDKTSWSKSYTIEANAKNDGHYKFSVYGEDKAGNALVLTEQDPTGQDNSGNYANRNSKNKFTSSYDMVMDATNPVVSMEVQTKALHSKRNDEYNHRYYFNQPFTATVSVDETNFANDKMVATYGYEQAENSNYATAQVQANANNKLGVDHQKYTYTGTMDGVYVLAVKGTDRAGNPIVWKAKNKELYAQDGEIGAFTSYVFAVDTVAPEIKVSMDDFYKAALAENAYSVSKNHPYRKVRQATVTLKDNDRTPVDLSYTIDATTTGTKQQADNQFVYNEKVTINRKGQQVFWMSALQATDLAGNVSKMQSATNKIYLDTEVPNNDQLAPTITMKATANGAGRGPKGNPLFDKTVTVRAEISDPNEVVSSSAIFRVYYKVTVNGDDWTDKVSVKSKNGKQVESGVVGYRASGSSYSEKASTVNEKLTYKDAIDFTFNANTFNYNDIKIVVWAEDNAGNIIKQSNGASFAFGIDTTSPTIRVTYDNNSVQNERYFKENRTATVVVTERNFDQSQTRIMTQSAASIGGWTYQKGGAANGDNDTWTCKVSYTQDGDYTFDVTTTDLLGHKSGAPTYEGTAPKDFVLDKTVPVITVSFDNNSVLNGKYYKADRTATIRVDEHNFSAAGATITVNNSTTQGNWGGSGDTHTASVGFNQDGNYTMNAQFTDLAGNIATPYTMEPFTLDKTVPELTLFVNGKVLREPVAYNGDDVIASLEYSDTNINASAITVKKLTGSKNGEIKLKGEPTLKNGKYVLTLDNIAQLPETDDIYTFDVTVQDLAGNETPDQIQFSVNRFGSNYTLMGGGDGYLTDKDISPSLDPNNPQVNYIGQPKTIRIKETNVNTLKFREITVSLDGEIKTLKEGVDYTVEDTSNSAGWKEYIYTISADVFKTNGVDKEGSYSITISSEDTASNKNSNRSGQFMLPIELVLDETPPTFTITGLEHDGRYVEDSREISVYVQDTIALKELQIWLDGQNIRTYTAEELMQTGGQVTVQLSASSDIQTLHVVAVDAAGHESEQNDYEYMLTSNLFSQYIHTPLAIGISVAVVAMIAGGIILVKRRKSRSEQRKG